MSDYSLEIHHLDVRGGDATAIIVRDMEQEVETGGKQVYAFVGSGAVVSGDTAAGSSAAASISATGGASATV